MGTTRRGTRQSIPKGLDHCLIIAIASLTHFPSETCNQMRLLHPVIGKRIYIGQGIKEKDQPLNHDMDCTISFKCINISHIKYEGYCDD